MTVDPAATTPSTDAPPLLQVEGLAVTYSVRRGILQRWARPDAGLVRAVDGVSLCIERGEMVALVGESGCGKSTTALAILRMVETASGAIRLDGSDITSMPQRKLRPLRRAMQMIYQDPYESFDPRFRVRATIDEGLIVHKLGSKVDREAKIVEGLERVGLSPAEQYLDRYPHELSGGQRQRVAIAASLVLGPALLIADEPVSMLDVSVRAGVLSLLDDMRRADRLGILMITHDLSTAAHFADRIAVMYLGRIVEEGPAKEVVANPRHPYTRALLSVVPSRNPRHRPTRQILKGDTPNPANIPSGCRFHPRCPIAEDQCRRIDPELRVPDGADSVSHKAACLLS